MHDIFQKAMTAFVQGKINEANKLCKGIIKQQPTAHPAIHLLALTEKRKGKYQQAIKTLNKALKLAPSTPTYWNNLGEIYREAGNTIKAIESYKKAIYHKKDYAEAYTNWGASLVSKREFEEAERHLATAIQIKPELANAHYNLGVLYTETGMPEQARQSFSTVLKIEPTSIESLVNLATLDQADGNPDDAKAKYLRAISLDPNNLEAHISLGSLCNNNGLYDEAIEHYSKATKIAPKSIDAWIGLGQACLNNSYLDAYHAFNNALSINGKSKEGMLGLAGSAIKNCDNDKALKTLLRYQEIHGKDVRSHLLLSETYLNIGNHAKAEIEARHCLEIDPGNILAYQVIAPSKKNQNVDGDMQQMLNLFNESNLTKTDRSVLAFSIARIMENRADYDTAFGYLKEANSLRKETFTNEIDYIEDIKKSIAQLKSTFTHELVNTNNKHGFDSNNPIFIVGLPRSGKTVIETALCNTTNAIPGGETRQFSRIVETELSNAKLDSSLTNITKLDRRLIYQIGEKYVTSLHSRFRSSKHVTNTLPGNASRLGTINMCLPNAKIIWVDRSQKYTCFDMCRKSFAKGHEYSYDLVTLARYTTEFNGLMEFWKELIPNNILQVQFEEFISEPDKWLAKLTEFCQLDMNIHVSDDTENSNQTIVDHEFLPGKKDIVDIWKPYEKYLQPLTEALEDS